MVARRLVCCKVAGCLIHGPITNEPGGKIDRSDGQGGRRAIGGSSTIFHRNRICTGIGSPDERKGKRRVGFAGDRFIVKLPLVAERCRTCRNNAKNRRLPRKSHQIFWLRRDIWRRNEVFVSM